MGNWRLTGASPRGRGHAPRGAWLWILDTIDGCTDTGCMIYMYHVWRGALFSVRLYLLISEESSENLSLMCSAPVYMSTVYSLFAAHGSVQEYEGGGR
eukprot:scaffold3330_cov128-Isochrysis_galbana.AAC.10